MMPGGFSSVKPATPEVQKIVDQVKAQLEGKENKTYPMFKAIEYMTQVVAGTIYLIKVQVGENDYVHMRVFQSLPHENKGPELAGYQTGKTRNDPLNNF